MDEFIVSAKIQKIEDFVSRNRERFKVNSGDVQFPIDNKRIINAMLRLCRLWNANEKSRNYVKKLIQKFLPFDATRKVDEFDDESEAYDAILNKVKLAGLNDIASKCNIFTRTYAHSNSLIDAQKESGDYQSFENREDEIREWCLKLPIEILHADFGYYAPNCDKYLCRESVHALKNFVKISASEVGEQEIIDIMNNITRKAQKRLKRSIGNNISDQEVLDKFSKMGTL